MTTDTENIIVKKITVDDVEIQMAGITPTGEIEITENGTYDVSDCAIANVNVPTGGGGEYHIKVTDVMDENGNSTQELHITLATEDKELTITLPEEFADCSEYIYTFKVTNDKVLFSANYTDIGIWLYTISTDSWKHVYTTDKYWQYFQQVTDTLCLITGGNTDNSGLLLYNAVTDEITKLYSSGRAWKTFKKVTDYKWLIGAEYTNPSSEGILLFDTRTKELRRIHDTGVFWLSFQQVSESKWLMNTNNSRGQQIALYDSDTDIVAKLYDEGASWVYIKVTDDKWLITAYGKGILLYTISLNTIILLDDNYKGRTIGYSINGKCLLSGTSSSYKGLLLYKSDDDSITELTADCYDYKSAIYVDNVILLSCTASSTGGIWLFDGLTDELSKIYTKDYNVFKLLETPTHVLISSTSSGDTGIKSYDKTTREIIKFSDKGYNWQYIQQLPDNKYLISGSGNISSSLILYYGDTNTIKILWDHFGFDTFTRDGDAYNYYITRTSGTNSERVLYYDNTTESVKLVSYYIGEV